jgi:hypothetical protein
VFEGVFSELVLMVCLAVTLSGNFILHMET